MEKRVGKSFLLLAFLLGFTAGVLAAFYGAFHYLRNNLIIEREITLPPEECFSALSSAAWKMPNEWTVSSPVCSLPDTASGRTANFFLCSRTYAADLLSDPSDRKVAAILPCCIAAYGKDDGKYYAANLNTGLVGAILGGAPSRLFNGPIEKDKDFFFTVLAPASQEK